MSFKNAESKSMNRANDPNRHKCAVEWCNKPGSLSPSIAGDDKPFFCKTHFWNLQAKAGKQAGEYAGGIPLAEGVPSRYRSASEALTDIKNRLGIVDAEAAAEREAIQAESGCL